MQPSLQVAALVLLAAVNKFYKGIQEQKRAEQRSGKFSAWPGKEQRTSSLRIEKVKKQQLLGKWMIQVQESQA